MSRIDRERARARTAPTRPDPGAPDGEAPEPVEVPMEALGPEALRGVLESFVLREGTDYGERERTLEEKIADVRRQLARGEARIVFDPESESIDIVPMR